MDISNHYGNVMVELTSITTVDKKRKVCKDCGLPVHNNKRQLICPIKIKEDNVKKDKIKKHILNIDCLEDYDDDEMFELFAKTIGISVNSCKKLYSEISPDVWIDRKIDINKYIDNIHKCCCLNCGNVILEFSKNRIWKGKIYCDSCWDSRKGERFHYDHLNMFDKTDSICCMVDRGDDMEDIFSELDKCQILCLSCHHIVTSIEQKCGFTRIKTSLTRKYNNGDISEEKYNEEKRRYQGIYELKMKSIYGELKNRYSNGHK